MKKVAIVSYYPEKIIQYRSQLAEHDFIIAADSGANALHQIGILPDLCIGDFDSADMKIINDAPHVIMLSPHKDETDTHAALRYAYDNLQAKTVTLFVSMSGRSDHQFGLLSLYYQFIERGFNLHMRTNQGKIMMLLPGKYVFQRGEETYVSCFAYTKDVENLSITGALYPLENAQLKVGSDLCCSNQFADSEIEINFASGVLIVYFIEEEVEG